MSTFTDIATTVTAIATALAAGASWRSASSSSAAAEDAREAIALSIPPDVQMELAFDTEIRDGTNWPTGEVLTRVMGAMWPATDLSLEIRYRNGRTSHQRRERLEPGEQWLAAIEGVLVAGPDSFDEFREKIGSVVLSYSDNRGIARYEGSIRPDTRDHHRPHFVDHARRTR